ncbi:hypothetical protein [Treponema pedis]|uniref:hypothetical protein n=1 Tax=Treponema pedis TaxID=409322 RepID=UPI000493EFC3|nr:hypothetical protein [Treponema pedis]
MDMTKRPSRLPKAIGLLIMTAGSAVFFIIGFGIQHKYKNTASTGSFAHALSKETAHIETKKDKTIFIYTDIYSVERNDYMYEIKDEAGKRIEFTKLSGKRAIPLDGKIMEQFIPTASFSAPGGTVSVYCDTSGSARGEFFIGSEVRAKTISWQAVLFFISGIIVLILGFKIGIKNILIRKEWFEKYGN